MTGERPAELPVDVVLPAYGDGALLREAVRSVLAQDVPDWRLTVVDDRADGPGDDLGAWLASLGDERVRYLANPVRLGINRNFQRCIDLATAPLVVVLGADDRMLPDYVRVVRAAAARHPDAAWIHPGVRVIDGAGRPAAPLGDRVKALLARRAPAEGPPAERLSGGEGLAASLLAGNWMYFPAVAFRRSDVAAFGFREGYDVILDLDLYLRMLAAGRRALLLSEVCFEYRRHAASLSSTEAVSGARFAEERRYFADAAASAAAMGWPRAARAARRHLTSRLHAAIALPAAVRSGRLRLAAALVRHALGPTGRAQPAGWDEPARPSPSSAASGSSTSA